MVINFRKLSAISLPPPLGGTHTKLHTHTGIYIRLSKTRSVWMRYPDAPMDSGHASPHAAVRAHPPASQWTVPSWSRYLDHLPLLIDLL